MILGDLKHRAVRVNIQGNLRKTYLCNRKERREKNEETIIIINTDKLYANVC